MFSQKQIQRFWSRVDQSGDCWQWLGLLDHHGYGSIALMSAEIDKRRWKAHRLAWQLTQGAIPEDKVLDHLCRNRACVNPSHLRVVTHRQNSVENSESLAAQNASKKLCLHGHSDWKVTVQSGRTHKRRVCMTCKRERAKRARKPRA